MKNILLIMLLLIVSLGSVQADETLRLSQKDAQQLHAFLLSDELLDFGERNESASALLMAVELMIDYPTRDQEKETLLSLCQQASLLAPSDNFVQSWVTRLETRARKSSRSEKSVYWSKSGKLKANQSLDVPAGFVAAWCKDDNIELQALDEQGKTLAQGNELVLNADSRTSVHRWRIINQSKKPTRFRVLFKMGL